MIEDFPDEKHGTVPLHSVYPRLSETPGSIRWEAPKLGQHTDEILDLIGTSEEDRRKLKEAGIV